jgi:hypothetical protein
VTKPARAIRPVEDDGTPSGPFDVPIDGTGLALPKLRVTTADGSTYDVQAYNSDLLAFEDTAAKHRWKGPADAPFRWLTFLAWSASRRTGRIDNSMSWETFAATTLQVQNLESATANPTREAADPAS